MSIIRTDYKIVPSNWKRLLLFCHYLNYEYKSDELPDSSGEFIYNSLKTQLCDTKIGSELSNEIFERTSNDGLVSLISFCRLLLGEMNLVSKKHINFIDVDSWAYLISEFNIALDIIETAKEKIEWSDWNKEHIYEFDEYCCLFQDGIEEMWGKQEMVWKCFEPILGDHIYSGYDYFLMIIDDTHHKCLYERLLESSVPINREKLFLFPISNKKISLLAFIITLLYCTGKKEDSYDLLNALKTSTVWKNYPQNDWIDKFRCNDSCLIEQSRQDTSVTDELSKLLERPTFSQALTNHQLIKEINEKEAYTIPTLWSNLSNYNDKEITIGQLYSCVKDEVRYFRGIQMQLSNEFVSENVENNIWRYQKSVSDNLEVLDEWFDYAVLNMGNDNIVRTKKESYSKGDSSFVVYENEGIIDKLWFWAEYQKNYFEVEGEKSINNVLVSKVIDRYIEQDKKSLDIITEYIEEQKESIHNIFSENIGANKRNDKDIRDFISNHTNKLFKNNNNVLTGSGAGLARALIEDDIVEPQSGWQRAISELLSDVEMEDVIFNGTDLILSGKKDLNSILSQSKLTLITDMIQWERVEGVFITKEGRKLSSEDIETFFVHNMDVSSKRALIKKLILRYFQPIRK